MMSLINKVNKLMDPSGFEPEASRVQGGRSSRLIYGPENPRVV